MAKPTARKKWGSLGTTKKVDLPALIIIAAACCFVAGTCLNRSHDFFFFPFFLAVLAADQLFARCGKIPPDEAAWREFLQCYLPDIRTAIYRVIGFTPHGHHAHLYEDVLQRFYLRLVENERRTLRSFRGKTDGEARMFLRRVAASVAINFLHQEQPPHVPLDEHKEESRCHSETLADPSVLNDEYLLWRKTIDDCLEQILHGHNKERNLTIFKLAVYEGLSPQDIASVPGLEAGSVHAIEQQITRIRRKLRQRLKKK
jgi:RNA polymerase sigma factor (sigma-70 family)